MIFTLLFYITGVTIKNQKKMQNISEQQKMKTNIKHATVGIKNTFSISAVFRYISNVFKMILKANCVTVNGELLHCTLASCGCTF